MHEIDHLRLCAEKVEREWKNWLKGPAVFPTMDFWQAITELCEYILNRKLSISPKES